MKNFNKQINRKFDVLKICVALIAMFFSGKFSQTAFKYVTQLFRSLYNVNISTSFKSCSKKLLDSNNHKFSYKKSWHFPSCKNVLQKTQTTEKEIYTQSPEYYSFFLIYIMQFLHYSYL